MLQKLHHRFWPKQPGVWFHNQHQLPKGQAPQESDPKKTFGAARSWLVKPRSRQAYQSACSNKHNKTFKSVLTAWDLLCPLCVCVFFTSYRVKTKKFFATGSLPRFVCGSFQTDPSNEYFENRYPTRTPLKSPAQFAKKKTRKIVMNNSRSRLLNQFLIIVMVHLNPLSSFIFSTISSLKASATAVLIANPLLAKSMAGWTRSFQGNLPYSLHARNWPWTSPGTAIAKRPRKKKRYSSSTKLCQVPSRTAGKACLEGRQVLSIPQAVVLFS